jgi:hypothetical protein
MDPHMPSCILMAQLLGGPSPGASSAASDTLHALERARNRMKLALEAHGGQIEGQPGDDILARFSSVDAAALAACEMIERVYQLPPVCGARFGVRAGIELGQGEKARHEVSKLAAMARPAEPLLSAAAAPQLTSPTRQFAKVSPVEDAALGTGLVVLMRHAALAGTADSHERRPQRLRLRVRHQGRTLYVDAQHPSLMLGREPGNDLVLDDPRASRRHARIDFRNNRFALVDHSSNGSWVEPASGTAVFIKGEEAELPLHGRIGLGFPAMDGEAGVVDFEIH